MYIKIEHIIIQSLKLGKLIELLQNFIIICM